MAPTHPIKKVRDYLLEGRIKGRYFLNVQTQEIYRFDSIERGGSPSMSPTWINMEFHTLNSRGGFDGSYFGDLSNHLNDLEVTLREVKNLQAARRAKESRLAKTA